MGLKRLRATPIKDRLASWLFRWLMKHQPEQLRAMIQKASDAKVQSVALQTTMLYLDRLGFLHCAFCPQRFGLQRATIADGPTGTRDVHLCQPHYAEMNQLFHSNGNGQRKLEAV